MGHSCLKQFIFGEKPAFCDQIGLVDKVIPGISFTFTQVMYVCIYSYIHTWLFLLKYSIFIKISLFSKLLQATTFVPAGRNMVLCVIINLNILTKT